MQLLAVVVFLCFGASARAETVLLLDGRTFSGVIVGADEEAIEIKTNMERLRIEKARIKFVDFTAGQAAAGDLPVDLPGTEQPVRDLPLSMVEKGIEHPWLFSMGHRLALHDRQALNLPGLEAAIAYNVPLSQRFSLVPGLFYAKFRRSVGGNSDGVTLSGVELTGRFRGRGERRYFLEAGAGLYASDYDLKPEFASDCAPNLLACTADLAPGFGYVVGAGYELATRDQTTLAIGVRRRIFSPRADVTSTSSPGGTPTYYSQRIKFGATVVFLSLQFGF